MGRGAGQLGCGTSPEHGVSLCHLASGHAGLGTSVGSGKRSECRGVPAANDSYWANIVGDRERALILSASGAPAYAGHSAGSTHLPGSYTTSPRGPFVLGIVVQIVALGLTLFLPREGTKQQAV